MKDLVWKLAAAALAGVATVGSPAAAQDAPAPAAAQQQLDLSERRALQPLYEAYRVRNWPTLLAAVPAARNAVRSGYGRYVLGQLQFQAGIYSGNLQAQAEGIDLMLASGAAPAAELPGLLHNQAAFALQADAADRAEAAVTRLVELDPGNPQYLATLAELKLRLADDPRRGSDRGRREAQKREALTLYQRALAAAAAGRPMPESFYQRAAGLGLEAGSIPFATAAGQALVAAYPNSINWRDALLQLRDQYAGDPAYALDIGRLMGRTGALGGERDYVELAEALLRADRAVEAKMVLDRGVGAGMIAPSEAKARDLIARAGRAATAEVRGLAARQTQARSAATGAAALAVGDTLFGQEQYAQAAEFYRLALEKGGEDPNLVNSRLGAALALAGNRAEGEAALRAVAGPRQPLAAYWLIHLARTPAA